MIDVGRLGRIRISRAHWAMSQVSGQRGCAGVEQRIRRSAL